MNFTLERGVSVKVNKHAKYLGRR